MERTPEHVVHVQQQDTEIAQGIKTFGSTSWLDVSYILSTHPWMRLSFKILLLVKVIMVLIVSILYCKL